MAVRYSHANALSWTLEDPYDYLNLVEFLDATKDFCVDNQQLRGWVTLTPLEGVQNLSGCSLPVDSPITPWNEFSFFDPQRAILHDYCTDYLGWASLIGRFAQDYPQLVALGIDDFLHDSNSPSHFPEGYMAELESRLR